MNVPFRDADMQDALRRPLKPSAAITYWQVGETAEKPYDVPDAPMAGEMDPFFFLTKQKNFIPHEYPCRTQFAAEHRGRRPILLPETPPTRWWLPFGSPRVDLSGFWFRATHIANRAETVIEAATAGVAKLRLVTCGGAILTVNGREAGWLAPYTRNLEEVSEFEVTLAAGPNTITVAFDDLAERDARFFFELDYLEGPAASIALPVPVDNAVADALEAALEDMHFDRPAYFGGEVAIILPAPLPIAVTVQVQTDGDTRLVGLAAGTDRIELGAAAGLPSGYRHMVVSLTHAGFTASRGVAIEICHSQADASTDLTARMEEALQAGTHRLSTTSAFARLALGRPGPDTDAMIEALLPAIENCHDCADFALVPLLWARKAWGTEIGGAIRERLDAAILGYRYWMDEPGNDVQWYFSENHALLFHTAAYLAGHLFPDATFRRSGRTGSEQSAVGETRVRAWLDHFERWEMAEFNSAPYFPIDLKGLCTLAALAPDSTIRQRAARGICRLAEIVARSAHHGIVTAAQGRSYEHSLCPSRTLELSAVARLLWGKGFYGGDFHALPLLAVALRDHRLTLPDFGPIASWSAPEHQEWLFAQGHDRFARLYHYKSAAFAIGSAARYRWGEWGYQETVLDLRLGENPDAHIWINHPGETIQFGTGRPSYWGGSGTLPRAQQYRGLALLDFAVHDGQPDFTHAWFPAAAFDESRVAGRIAVARSGNGIAILIGSTDLVPMTNGPSAGIELRLPGRRTRWIVRVAEGATLASAWRFSSLSAEQQGDDFIVTDPEYGAVTFRADGTVTAEGRTLDPENWTIAGEARTLPQ